MKHRLFVRTELTVDGAGTVIHVADLEPIDDDYCRMVRMIELDPNDAITGAVHEGRTAGMANQPNDVVPHPDTYDQFPDISSRRLDKQEFEGLWTEATTLFPNL